MKTTAQDLLKQGYHLYYIPETDNSNTIGPKLMSVYDETHGDTFTRERLTNQFISSYSQNKPVFENKLTVNNKIYKTIRPVYNWSIHSLVFAKEI